MTKPFAIETLLALMLAATSAQAASFDCKKASTSVEKAICADPEASTLDDQLLVAYRARLGQTPALKESQRHWLTATRDQCTSTSCLRNAYAARLAEIQAMPLRCPITRAQLVGSWMNQDDTVDPFEEAELSGGPEPAGFVSFVHHAAFITGTWSFKGCQLHVAGTGNQTDIDFVATSYFQGLLTLSDPVDGTTVRLRRAK